MWKFYTKDDWILETINGYKIELESIPSQDFIPSEISFSPKEREVVDNEILELSKKGAIVHSYWEENQFLSNIFVVPKPNGKYRPIINLKRLNKFVKYEHFKQEHFKVVLDLIQQNDFFTSVDLCDAYFSVPIHIDYQKFLKFEWNNVLWKFVCLPFGLSSAPKVFTKILKPVYAWLRQQGVRCAYYIDDSLNMNQTAEVCGQNTDLICNTLTSLGFSINKKKSQFLPTQRIVFFGFLLDSVEFKVFLTEDKICKIIDKANILLNKNIVVIRDLASFIGLIINAFHAVLEAKMHYRCLERDKINGLDQSGNYEKCITLSKGSREELKWWIINVVMKNGKRIRPVKVQFQCTSDASCLGWGCCDIASNKIAQGQWSVIEAQMHINYLELLAIFLTLKSLYKHVSDTHIQIQCDNVCAISYVNDMGGMASMGMNDLAFDIWTWCLKRNIFISAVYIPGSDNVVADYFSRNFSDSTEWMLKSDIFKRLCNHFFQPDFDLFASKLNRQLKDFVSWFPDTEAKFYDAFSISWHGLLPYAFPPFNMLSKVVNKIVEDKVEKIIVVLPFWKSQSWFPLVLANIADFPVRLPRHRDLLVLPSNGQRHPLAKKIKMVGVVLSGDPLLVEAFHQKLRMLSYNRGEMELVSNMQWHGQDGIFGVYKSLKIPFMRLNLI
jgi:hypothetical protein